MKENARDNGKNLDYVLIRDFIRFMTIGTKHHSQNHSCWYWLQYFSTCKKNIKNCQAINHTKSVSLPPLIKYANFKSILKHRTNDNNDDSNTKNISYHIACSYDYKLVCVDEQYSRPYKTYFGKNPIDKCISDKTDGSG